MTLKQYLIHLWRWLRLFPFPNDDAHVYIGEFGNKEYECMDCGRKKIDVAEPEPTDEEIEEFETQ